MALNYIGQESLPNGLPVWHFEDPNDKARFSTLDPGQAFTLGAPTPSDEAARGMVNPTPQVAAPAPMPDERLVSAGPAPGTYGQVERNARVGASDPSLVAAPPPTPVPPTPTPVAAPSTGYTAETIGNELPAMAPVSAVAAPLTVEQLIPEQPGVVGESDLQRRYSAGTPGGFAPTGRSVKGVTPEDKATLQQQADALYESQLQTAEARALAERDERLLQSTEAQVRMGQLQQEQRAQEAIAAKQEEEKQAVMARIQADEQAVQSRHPSMKNVWKDGGTLGIAALFAGLGELGAGLTRSGRNTALDMINRGVEQNLNEQAAAIAADKDALGARKNAYAMYLADGHDPKFARLAAKNLALKLEEERLLDKNVQRQLTNAGVEYMSTVDGIKAERLKTMTEMAKLTEVSQAEKYTAPRKGGFETEEQVLARALRTAKVRAELGELQGTRLTPAERATVVKDRSTAVAPGSQKVSSTAVGGVAGALSNLTVYDTAIKDIDAAFGKKDAEIELNPGAIRNAQPVDQFFFGEQSAREDRYGKDGAAVINAIEQVLTNTRKESMGVMSPSERENRIKAIVGDGKPETIRRNLMREKAQGQTQLVLQLQGADPRERKQILDTADPETRAMMEQALSGQRPVQFTPDE